MPMYSHRHSPAFKIVLSLRRQGVEETFDALPLSYRAACSRGPESNREPSGYEPCSSFCIRRKPSHGPAGDVSFPTHATRTIRNQVRADKWFGETGHVSNVVHSSIRLFTTTYATFEIRPTQ